MVKSIKNFFCCAGMLVSLSALLFLSPAASIRSEAVGPEVAVGIDVSKYQGGINWQQVSASGVRFAMIRVGTTKKGLDEQFVNNINGANAAGVRTGIYLYSYATTPEAAAAEANQVLAWIAPYTVTFPIAIDIEDSVHKGLNAAQLQAIADTFCGIISANGYEPMVYASRNWFVGRMPVVSAPKWVAQYSSACDYPGDYAMWQSSSQGNYAGINTRVDVNHLYVDYFSKIVQEGFSSWGEHVSYYHDYRKQFGWINLGGQRYHADGNGFIQTGWFNDESGVYYLDGANGGVARTGVVDIEGVRYVFNENGQRSTGLVNVGGTVYFANEEGVCQTGLIQLEDGVHFFDEQGAMRTGLTQVGEQLYCFDANGVMQKGMVDLETGRYLFGEDGVAVSGWYSNDQGQRFYFAPAAMVGLQAIEGANYLFADDGVMAIGWAQFPEGWRYFDANTGAMLASTTAVLEEVSCAFNESGILTDPAGWTPGTPAPAVDVAPEAVPVEGQEVAPEAAPEGEPEAVEVTEESGEQVQEESQESTEEVIDVSEEESNESEESSEESGEE